MGIREIIANKIDDLPTLPTIHSALSEAIARPNSTAREISEIISSDQAASFRILKVVNSVFYGFPGRVDTISRAVVILGFDEVSNLILALSVMDLFSKSASVLGFRPSDFWAHSIAVGMLTRQIGQAAGMLTQEHLFVAGIMHDIGKLAFFEFTQEEFGRALTYASEHNCRIIEAERAMMEIDHTTAGLLLAERWRLPQSLKNAISHHHEGRVAGMADPLVASVHLADIIARALELGFPGDNTVPEPAEHIWDTLRLPEGIFDKIIAKFMPQYEEQMNMMLNK
ncbi:MAG: HDOD domain-containing protein [Candidatus Sumerlaeota bacterium]|nr:HDOD domain-containing protein [Candidatus Sumerlaeota bacterium]